MQPLRLQLLQLLCTIAGAQMPTFNDEILGNLVVSKERYPFLTPESTLEKVHVFPTDQQLELIEKATAAGGMLSRSGEGAGVGSFIEDALSWFFNNRESLGDFLKFEFDTEINHTVLDPGGLPFDKINANTYFKAMVFDRDQFVPYLEGHFNPRLRSWAATEKRWLPADKIITELRDCTYTDYGHVMDADFKFDENTGGVMVEYKVICKRVGGSFYLVFSLYGNTFTLKDIEHEDFIKSPWSFLKFSGHSTEVKHWFEKRYITPEQFRNLTDFIFYDTGKVIQREYQQYIDDDLEPGVLPSVLRFIAMGMILILVSLVIAVPGCLIFKRCRRAKNGHLDDSTANLVGPHAEEI